MISLKRSHWLALLILAVVHFAFWWNWLSPYRYFPGDDLTLIKYGINIHIPVFEIVQAGVNAVWGWVSATELNGLLINTLLSGSLTLVSVGALTFLLTQSLPAAIAAAVVFGTNGWASSYYIVASYAPLANAFSTFALFFAFQAWQGRASQTTRVTGIQLAAAGLLTGLFLFTSSGAPVLGFLIFLLVATLCWDGSFETWRGRVACFLGPLTLVLLTFSSRLVRAYVHLHENVNTYHYTDALKVFGYIPKPPFFTFYRVGLVSSPILFWFLIGSLAFVAGLLAWRWRSPNRDRGLTLLGTLGMILIAHAMIIDLLPFTKLGRTHFPLLPLAIVFTAAVVYRAINMMSSRILRMAGTAVALSVAILTTFDQVRYDQRMVGTRLGPQRFFANLPEGTRIYGHPDDPTGYFLVLWMEFKAFGAHSMSEVKRSAPGTPTVFVVGPHGERSGRTVLRHSALSDFVFDPAKISRPPGAVEIKFPYYGFFPGFLMEEEISMALYFAGEAADFEAPNLQMTIWAW